MAVTVAAAKTVSFKSPYTGATFQDLTSLIMGRDGYLSGGVTSDDGVTIEVEPVAIAQRGIIATTAVDAVGITVPTAAEPWFLLAAIPDDDPDSGISFSVTADLGVAANSVIVAFKSNGAWQNPVPVSIAGAAVSNADPGVEVGGGVRELMDASGVVTYVAAFRGGLVDPDGNRRSLPRSGANSARAFSLTPLAPSPIGNRNDRVLLRQRESFSPEIVYAMGSVATPTTVPAAIALASGAGVAHPSYFGRRGGTIGQQWWAWADGTNLKIQGGPAGTPFAATTLLTSGLAIAHTCLVGQRASDSAVILLYVDGADLRLVSFNPLTGVQVDAPVTLEGLSGQVSRPRAFLDGAEKLHIAFDHDEGVRQQVYYTRCQVAVGAGFGLADVSPRIINGVDTGSNDTWPDIAVDRRGVVTIAHVRGTGANEHGDVVVAVIDSSGITESQQTIFAAAGTGIDTGIATGLNTGAVATVMLSLRRPAVAITPHDEVNVFVLGLSAGTDVDYVLLHRPGFGETVGFDLINPLPRMETGFSLDALAAEAGELGEVHIAFKLTGAASAVKYRQVTFDTELLRDGRAPLAPLLSTDFVTGTDASAFADLRFVRGQLGELVASYMIDTTATTRRLPGLDQAGVTIHPRDVALGGWTVKSGSGTTLDGRDKEFELFSARPKRMNYPFLVGNEGDFQGYGSLHAAVAQANRLGGEVVIRPGQYPLSHQLRLLGGVSLNGEGATLILTGANSQGIVMGAGSYSADAVTVAGSIVSGSDVLISTIKSGDFVTLTSGKHRVLRALGYDTATSTYKLLVDPDGATPPASAFMTPLYADMALENLSISSLAATVDRALLVGPAIGVRLRNLRFDGDTNFLLDSMVSISSSENVLVDGLDMRQVVMSNTESVVSVVGCAKVTLRGIRLADGKGMITVGATAHDVVLEGCGGDNTDATKTVYNLTGTRTTPLYVVNCEGRFAGDGASIALVRTEVGSRLRAPEGIDAMSFEDGNTRASTIVDLGIKLSSAAHREFDGVSKDVITDAVNERVKVGGDTMTGPLVFAAGDERVLRSGDTMTGALTMGANILTNGTSRVLGASGVAANRYGLFANDVDILGTVLTPLSVNPAAAAASPLITLTADGSETVSLLNIIARSGLGSQFNVNALGIENHNYRSDRYDLTDYDVANTAGFFGDQYSGGGGTKSVDLDGVTDARLRFSVSNTSGAYVGARHKNIGQCRFPLAARSGFTVKFRIPTTLLSRVDWWGFCTSGEFDLGGSVNRGAVIVRDTAVDGTSLFFHYTQNDGPQTQRKQSLSFNPVADTWYYMTMVVLALAPSGVLFRIGTTANWQSGDTISSFNPLFDMEEDGGTLSNAEWQFTTGCATSAAVAKAMDIGWIQIFSLGDGY